MLEEQIVEDEASSAEQSSSLPEIEARICDKSILVKIHSRKRKGVLVKLLAEVESLNLAVVNTSLTPFGTSELDITITAEMDNEISLKETDIVTALQSALQAAG